MTVRIRVAYYLPEQLDVLPTHTLVGSERWDVSFNHGNPLMEYGLFARLLEGWSGDYAYEGIFSWKWARKSGVDPRYLNSQIEAAVCSGRDAIIFNPMIANNALFENMWSQAIAVGHPEFDVLMHKMGLSHFEECVLPPETFSACSYVIGTQRFWSQYMDYVDSWLDRCDDLAGVDPEFARIYFGSAGYHRDLSLDYRPFVIERLLQNFLTEFTNYSFIEPTSDWFRAKFGDHAKYLSTLYALKQQVAFGELEYSVWRDMRDQTVPLGSPEFFDILHLDDPAIDLTNGVR